MFSFIHVVVQGHTEKPRLHVIALATYKVGPTGTLAIVHRTSGDRRHNSKNKAPLAKPLNNINGMGLAKSRQHSTAPMASDRLPSTYDLCGDQNFYC